jgi:DNA-binding NarL/FixJ family response regulator
VPERRIIIVEDDWIVAHGIREMLRADGFHVVGIASRAERVEALIQEHTPALALVDIDLGRDGDGIALARDVLAKHGVRIVFASAHADEATLARLRSTRAAGFVVKPFTQKQLRAAIEIALAVPDPRPLASAGVEEQLASAQRALAELAGMLGAPQKAQEVSVRLRPDPRLEVLSEREREVLLGLLEHRRVPSIAAHLRISAHTVRNHLKAIFAKLRVSSQQELLDLVIDRPPSASLRTAHDEGESPTSEQRLRVRG